MRKAARKLKLIDKPSSRKNHQGNIPIAGGIAICITLSNLLYSRPDIIPNNILLLTAIITLVLIGAFDDRYDLKAWIRLPLQALISIIFIHISGLHINQLGNLLGFGDILIGPFWGSLLTVLGILGAINAFNMIDGLDGLLGMLSIVTFASLGILFHIQDELTIAYFCLLIVVCILPYVFMNLGILGRQRKVFMGDAGSMMIGFIAIYFLLIGSQSTNNYAIRTVTALWVIAIPLMDMVATISRRLKRGHSPFLSDRDHIHYILLDLGFSPLQVLFILCCLAYGCAIIGILGEVFKIETYIMFYAFIACFAIYACSLQRLKKAIKRKLDNL